MAVEECDGEAAGGPSGAECIEHRRSHVKESSVVDKLVALNVRTYVL